LAYSGFGSSVGLVSSIFGTYIGIDASVVFGISMSFGVKDLVDIFGANSTGMCSVLCFLAKSIY
jgi:hypothetical protein